MRLLSPVRGLLLLVGTSSLRLQGGSSRLAVVLAGVLMVMSSMASANAQDTLPPAPSSTARATPVGIDMLFAGANEAYEQEHYEAAALDYQRVIQAGVRDATVYHNLGNTMYRLGKIGPAILAYERALDLAPGDARIRENLEYVASRSIDRVSDGPVEEGPLTALWAWHGRLSPGVVTGMFLLVWLVFNACLALTLYSTPERLRRVSSYALAASLVGVMVTALVLGSLIYRRDAVVRGIVLPARVDLQSVPGGGVTLTTVHEGLAVRVRGTRGDWLEVSLPNGMRGWVAQSSIGVI